MTTELDSRLRKPWSRAVSAIAWLLFAQIVVFQIRQVVTASVLYDDAFIASVAKNVVTGFGYSTTYPSIVPFDPEISTGPVIVFPAAALMKLAGNRFWVPNLAITICFWAALMPVVLLLLRRHPASERSVFFALVAIAMLALTTENYGLVGETPASYLVVLSALTIELGLEGVDRPGIVFLSGLALGLAVECKLLTALAAIPFVFVLAKQRALLRWLAGMAMPVVAWQVLQLALLQWDVPAWLRVKNHQIAFLLNSKSLSGADQLLQTPSLAAHVLTNAIRNLGDLQNLAGVGVYALAFVSALAIAAIISHRSSRGEPGRTLLAEYLLIAAAVCHLLWWSTLSPTGWFRHLLPAIIYASFAAALLVARSISSDRYTIVGCLCAATLVCSACPRREHMAGVLRFDFAPSPRLAALLATRDQVLALQKRGNTVLGGWGWWVPRDLEYVLPASGNFVDLSTWTRHSKSEDVLLIRNEFFNWDHIESLERLREICDKHMVFSRDPFVISECTDFGRPATPGHD